MASEPRRPGVVLDAGALLAVESGALTGVIDQAFAHHVPIRTSGAAVAQAWGGGPRSARLASLLKKNIVVVAIDALEGRRIGELIARLKLPRHVRPDVVDAHVALLTRETSSLLYTSDPDDRKRCADPTSRAGRADGKVGTCPSQRSTTRRKSDETSSELSSRAA